MFNTLAIFILLCVSTASADIISKNLEKKSQTYGNYCGLGHGSNLGIEPIDSLDRICQIHDICVSALGYTSCACNEQLYASATQVYITTQEQKNMRDFILSNIYDAILPCSNYNGLGKWYFINAKVLGQNYLPFFPYSTGSKYVKITYNNLFKYYLIDNYNYKIFTQNILDGYNAFPNLDQVHNEFVEIPQNKILVAITFFLDEDNATTLEILEIDFGTSSYISVQKASKEIYNIFSYKTELIVVSSSMGVIILILSAGFIIYVYKKRKSGPEYAVHQNQNENMIEF